MSSCGRLIGLFRSNVEGLGAQFPKIRIPGGPLSFFHRVPSFFACLFCLRRTPKINFLVFFL
jgi:hypothetical protein